MKQTWTVATHRNSEEKDIPVFDKQNTTPNLTKHQDGTTLSPMAASMEERVITGQCQAQFSRVFLVK